MPANNSETATWVVYQDHWVVSPVRYCAYNRTPF